MKVLIFVVAVVGLAIGILAGGSGEQNQWSFENPKCEKWGKKKFRMCVKKGERKCLRYKFKKHKYCAKFTPFCKKFAVKVHKKCAGKKAFCEEYRFGHKNTCTEHKNVCSGIKYKTIQKRIMKKGKCKKFVYHTYPKCAEKKTICWSKGIREHGFCKNKVRKCVEKGVKMMKPRCAQFATIYRRGPKYCTKYAPVHKCVRYQRKKYCAKYAKVTLKKRWANRRKDLVIGNKYKDVGKKCIRWKYYCPLRKERKCIKYFKKRICDVKISSSTSFNSKSSKHSPTGSPFKPYSYHSKCLKYVFEQSHKCKKAIIVKRKICLRKKVFKQRCVQFKRPIIKKQTCVAYKTPFKFYCKKHETFCNDFGKTEKVFCRKHKKVCSRYVMARKPIYCLQHHYHFQTKQVKKPVCKFTRECVQYKSTPWRKCKKIGHKCIKFHLHKHKFCVRRARKCTKIGFKPGNKRYCVAYSKPKCKVFKHFFKKVCLLSKHKPHNAAPKK